jgi:hypothetical protein
MRRDLGWIVFIGGTLLVALVAWNLAGSVTSQALAPHPSASASAVAVVASASPSAVPPTSGGGSAAPSSAAVSSSAPAEPSAAASAEPSASPTPTPTPKPVRKPVNVRIEPRPAAAFVTEQKNTWCAAAAVQITLNVNGKDARIDTTRARQARIRELQVELTTRRDSKNGGAGPLGMVASLERLGTVDYELRIYDTRAEALHASAKAIRETGHAAILLAWRGAHAWVMTGYRADADPADFRNAKVTGAYIVDPWYPRVSSIWGRSDEPGVFQDAAEMKRNYLPWKRPEGRYPGRDGKFLAIVPVS